MVTKRICEVWAIAFEPLLLDFNLSSHLLAGSLWVGYLTSLALSLPTDQQGPNINCLLDVSSNDAADINIGNSCFARAWHFYTAQTYQDRSFSTLESLSILLFAFHFFLFS